MTPITLRGIIIKNVGALQAPPAHVQFGGGHEHKGVPFYLFFNLHHNSKLTHLAIIAVGQVRYRDTQTIDLFARLTENR